MSQKKVDKYKENKKNRKQTIAKEKREAARLKIVGYILATLVVVGLVVGIGVTVWNLVGSTGTGDFRPNSFVVGDATGMLETPAPSTSATESESATGSTSATEAATESTAAESK